MASNGIDRTGAAGGSGASSLIGAFAELADPGADSIIYWNDTSGSFGWYTLDNDFRTAVGLGTGDSPEFADVGTSVDGGIVYAGDASDRVRMFTSGTTSFLEMGENVSGAHAQLEFDRTIPVLKIRVGTTGVSDKAWLQLYGSGVVRFYDGAETDYVGFSHDGTDFNITSSNTTGINIATGVYLAVADNIGIGRDPESAYGLDTIKPIRARGASLFVASNGTDYVSFEHDGTDFNLVGVNTTDINITGVTNVNLNGVPLTSITLGTPQLPSAVTSAAFTTIPTGVKRITINFRDVAFDGAANGLIMLVGPAGGLATSGYTGVTYSGGAGEASTGHFPLARDAYASTNTFTGVAVLTLLSSTSNVWCLSGTMAIPGSTQVAEFAGGVELSGPLTQLSLREQTGSAFKTSSNINILYE